MTIRLNMIFLGYNDDKEAYIEDAFHVRVPLQRLQLLLQLKERVRQTLRPGSWGRASSARR